MMAAAARRGFQFFGSNRRWISKFVNPDVVNTQVRKLEAEGVPNKQAEAIMTAVREILNESLAKFGETQNIDTTQELPKLKSKGKSREVTKLEAEGVPSKQKQRKTEVSKSEVQKIETTEEMSKIDATEELSKTDARATQELFKEAELTDEIRIKTQTIRDTVYELWKSLSREERFRIIPILQRFEHLRENTSLETYYRHWEHIIRFEKSPDAKSVRHMQQKWRANGEDECAEEMEQVLMKCLESDLKLLAKAELTDQKCIKTQTVEELYESLSREERHRISSKYDDITELFRKTRQYTDCRVLEHLVRSEESIIIEMSRQQQKKLEQKLQQLMESDEGLEITTDAAEELSKNDASATQELSKVLAKAELTDQKCIKTQTLKELYENLSREEWRRIFFKHQDIVRLLQYTSLDTSYRVWEHVVRSEGSNIIEMTRQEQKKFEQMLQELLESDEGVEMTV